MTVQNLQVDGAVDLKRIAFESWAIGPLGSWMPRVLKQRVGEGYGNPRLDEQWCCWKAATAEQITLDPASAKARETEVARLTVQVRNAQTRMERDMLVVALLEALERPVAQVTKCPIGQRVAVAEVVNDQPDDAGNLVNAHVRTIGDFDLEHLPHGTRLYLGQTVNPLALAPAGEIRNDTAQPGGCWHFQPSMGWEEMGSGTKLYTADSPYIGAFQMRVHHWMLQAFGPIIAADGRERNHRFLEESLELAQACDCTKSEAHQLVEYVFGRPVGEKSQEAGGVLTTLAGLCQAHGLSLMDCAETELDRNWTRIDAIRAKQAAKPKHSPLPQYVAPTSAGGWPAHWKQDGFNGCLSMSAKALTYLADNSRPSGGEQHFNSAHCHQLASELGVTMKSLLGAGNQQENAA